MSDIVFELPDEQKKAPKGAPSPVPSPAPQAAAPSNADSDIVFELPPEEPLALAALKKGWKTFTTGLSIPNNVKNRLVSRVAGLDKPSDTITNAPSFNEMADRAGEVPVLSKLQKLNEKVFGPLVAKGVKRFGLFAADAATDPLNWGAPALRAMGAKRAADAVDWVSGDKIAQKIGSSMYGAGAAPGVERLLADNPGMTRDQAIEILMREKIRGSRSTMAQQASAAADAYGAKHAHLPKMMTDAGQIIPASDVALITAELRAKANNFASMGGGQNASRAWELNSLANALDNKAWDPDAFEKTARNYRGLRYGDPELTRARNALTSRMRGAMDLAVREGVQRKIVTPSGEYSAGTIPMQEGLDYLKNRSNQSKMISAEQGFDADVAGQRGVWEQVGNKALQVPTLSPQGAAVRAAATVTKGALPYLGTNIGTFLKKYPKVLSTPARQAIYPGYEDPEQKLLNELTLD